MQNITTKIETDIDAHCFQCRRQGNHVTEEIAGMPYFHSICLPQTARAQQTLFLAFLLRFYDVCSIFEFRRFGSYSVTKLCAILADILCTAAAPTILLFHTGSLSLSLSRSIDVFIYATLCTILNKLH